MPSPELSVVLPAYNEEHAIIGTLDELAMVVRSCGIYAEFIVVDDGSSDGTPEVLRRYTAHDVRLRVLTHTRNRGYGAAVRSGFTGSCGQWVLLMDSDGQFCPGDLAEVWSKRAPMRAVLGYRAQRADPPNRLRNASLWNYGVRALVGVCVRDLDCAFKLFPGEELRKLVLRSDGAGISAELLCRWRAVGGTWVEVPVHHRPRVFGRQTGGRLGVILRGLWELLRISVIQRRERLFGSEPWESERIVPYRSKDNVPRSYR